ncbi:hypothetical protein [Xenorhabdus kozodoii]|uniref:Uncharacterized protein n=1 Tax=Xenorhabdus kozodoii TaxID=351676 RepID=A0A2D0LD15_9GAMM|nr:hypothetical protein [Xenorhabdus kozodoii]PHM73596.1 hypothetical protein Xkoz_01738 [Xenorhabdus kozodoii]
MIPSEKLTYMTTLSLVMSRLSLLIIILMIAINIFSWLEPKLILGRYGLGFSLTERILSSFDRGTLSAWRLTGGIFDIDDPTPIVDWAFFRFSSIVWQL